MIDAFLMYVSRNFTLDQNKQFYSFEFKAIYYLFLSANVKCFFFFLLCEMFIVAYFASVYFKTVKRYGFDTNKHQQRYIIDLNYQLIQRMVSVTN